MAEWLYEAGIGEARAALFAHGRIVAARIERDGGALRIGQVFRARLVERVSAGLVRVEAAEGAAVLDRVPPGLPLGAMLTVAVVREAIPEPGRVKLARVTPSDAPPAPAPDLLATCHASGLGVRMLRPHEPDALEAAGWSEVIDEALTGEMAFAGGALRMAPTPAMTLFDVDGPGDPARLAVAAAGAVAGAIVRHDVGGSIGIDFPTLAGKAARQAVAAAIDDALPLPFERTAVNGFGFLQIVRPRPRASLPELLRADPVATAALAMLRGAEREPPPIRSPRRVDAGVAAWLAARPALLDELARRAGGRIDFVP
ncbi:ribonuclease [uncultured Sphingomonas sp.]|uniref:ribonuclease n=1 Tax=uncultured Sphingomonas sp. TaxID=158754 RepID=UPI0035CAC867